MAIKKKKKMRGLLNKAAKKVARASGGKHLVEYAGSKIAKARAPKAQKKYIKSKSTGKQALGSAALVGLSATGAGKGIKVAAKAASKGLAKRAAAKKTLKRRMAEQNEPVSAKRRRLYEGQARKAATKRAQAKRGRRTKK
jgi:F0F1-type ATP synthase membrane subunit c/vacuolar-type H+-ATPase subunit K